MDALLERVGRFYNLSNLKSGKKIDTGYTSTNFILDADQGSFFLKQYDTKYSDSRVEMITRGTEFFKTEAIPAVTPIGNNNSTKHFRYNSRLYSLFPFIEGIVHEFDTLNSSILHEIGSTHGLILDRGKKVDLSKGAYREAINKLDDVRAHFNEEDQEIRNQLQSTDSTFNQKAEIIQNIKKEFAESNESRIEISLEDRSLVHGDYWHRNIIMKDNAVVGVIDFDKVKVDSRAKMVLRALDVICFNQTYEDSQYLHAEDYLQGLSESYKLEEGDFISAIAFWRINTMLNNQIVYHLIVRNNQKFSDLLDVNLERITAWGSDYEKHKEKLLNIYSEVYKSTS